MTEQEVRVLVIDLKIVKERLTQMLFQEAANGSVLKKRYCLKFCKIHRKTTVYESLF